ncbi:MAG: molybdenum cofactor biosynthesis protein B [Planctomycetota bacterium]|nr:molybdenum cofactor biosynthesis protein B [Planctomycetota bacterium]
MPHNEHTDKAKDIGKVVCHVLTVSDTRTPETDESGQLARDLLTGAGFHVASCEILRNDTFIVREKVELLLEQKPDLILLSGGTGIGRRDVSVEAVMPLLDKTLDGFGELFRWLSYQEIGSGAIMTRALMGVGSGTAVALLPGSPAAVRLALEKLIIPELKHILWEVRR